MPCVCVAVWCTYCFFLCFPRALAFPPLQSYRYFPVNLDVISWLGVWYVKSEMYEKAIEFFERAAEIQPAEVKWQLMVTSCYRRMGNFEKALKLYEAIHKQYPDNLECELLLFCLLLAAALSSSRALLTAGHPLAQRFRSALLGGDLQGPGPQARPLRGQAGAAGACHV